MIMAFTMLGNEHVFILYYLLSTSLITIATFLLKVRLYPLISEERLETEQDQTPKRILILTFCMLIAVLFVPLILAGFLSGASWFTLIVSYASGVSISEIIFYFSCTRWKKGKSENIEERN